MAAKSPKISKKTKPQQQQPAKKVKVFKHYFGF